MPEPDFPTHLSFAAARARLGEIAARHRLGEERIALETAQGRVLAQDLRAPFDVPGFANSAMDGYAVRGADLAMACRTPLRCLGVALAGGEAPPAIVAGTCVRITTGAALPLGADTVVIKENAVVENGGMRIVAGDTSPGANVRPAGEDHRAGDLALEKGLVLTAARLGTLASFGQADVAVVRRPRAVLLTTGDELVPPGQPLAAGRIHDSNRYSLGALIERAGGELLRHERLRDDPARLREALVRAGAEADFILSSGGVSAGEADYLPGLLGEIGKVYFWKVRIKPGLPFLCGRIGEALAFSLPGNPVSGIATFLALVQPALAAMSGRSETPPPLRARLTQTVRKRHDRVELLRVRLTCGDDATLLATPSPKQGSGMLAGVAEANALLLLPEPAQEYPAGTLVEAMPLPGAFD